MQSYYTDFFFEQTKSEGKLFERFSNLRINWKFGKLVSTIILKSWPKDDKGTSLEEEVLLKHLLGWTAAKNIFQLYGNYMVSIHMAFYF